jgi:hypothetical protein
LQHACQATAAAYGRRGEWAECERHLRECLAIARDTMDAAGVARTAGELGACLTKLARLDEATAMYQEQFDVAKSAGA